MPSSVLHDQIPRFLLLPTQPLFYLPPRVFGCVCFVHILTPRQDKLSTKATKCVFLGYSCLQRVYRCYSPNTNRYFISADVTFFKDSPFFSSAMRVLYGNGTFGNKKDKISSHGKILTKVRRNANNRNGGN